jgi:hypothetical protein
VYRFRHIRHGLVIAKQCLNVILLADHPAYRAVALSTVLSQRMRRGMCKACMPSLGDALVYTVTRSPEQCQQGWIPLVPAWGCNMSGAAFSSICACNVRQVEHEWRQGMQQGMVFLAQPGCDLVYNLCTTSCIHSSLQRGCPLSNYPTTAAHNVAAQRDHAYMSDVTLSQQRGHLSGPSLSGWPRCNRCQLPCLLASCLSIHRQRTVEGSIPTGAAPIVPSACAVAAWT